MKQYTKWIATVAAVTASLVIANPVLAQTQVISDMGNIIV